MSLKEIEAAWNYDAPENNQWDSILPEEQIEFAQKQARIECAKVCRSLADLRGVNDHHKYMADKCAMEIEKLNESTT